MTGTCPDAPASASRSIEPGPLTGERRRTPTCGSGGEEASAIPLSWARPAAIGITKDLSTCPRPVHAHANVHHIAVAPPVRSTSHSPRSRILRVRLPAFRG